MDKKEWITLLQCASAFYLVFSVIFTIGFISEGGEELFMVMTISITSMLTCLIVSFSLKYIKPVMRKQNE